MGGSECGSDSESVPLDLLGRYNSVFPSKEHYRIFRKIFRPQVEGMPGGVKRRGKGGDHGMLKKKVNCERVDQSNPRERVFTV